MIHFSDSLMNVYQPIDTARLAQTPPCMQSLGGPLYIDKKVLLGLFFLING